MRIIRAAVVLILVAAGFLAWRVMRPYQGFQNEVFVDIPRGTSTGGIADMLANAGVVRSRWDFIAARLVNPGRVLQAGEYRFHQPATAAEVFGRIARGDVFYYVLLVPEGRNMFDIGAAAEQLGVFSAAQFLEAAHNPAMIRDLDPKAPSLEGYLFPDTYKLKRKTTPERLCQMMTGRFREVWKGLNTTADVHDAVTLASLVEKESKVESERALIASVFTNRLRLGMKLDCDPTTIYAALLSKRYNGAIYRSDLDSSHPYNTYRHAGLPPGPIANPGVASIRAALHPEPSDALYFVLRPDGSGAHEFSNSMAEHEAAIGRYRRGNKR